MAIKKSAAKRHRQSVGRRLRNRMAKSNVKTSVKKFLSLVESKDKAAAQVEFAKIQKVLDSAAGKGIVHGNSAARKKSRLAKRLNSL